MAVVGPRCRPGPAAPSAIAATYITTSTSQSRVVRRPRLGAQHAARQQQALPARQLGACVAGSMCTRKRTARAAPRDPLPKSIAGIDAAALAPWRRPWRILAAMIESQGLTKRLSGRTVVHDVSFRCEPGTVTGFLGPNGAGKTTTLRMLTGLTRPDGGTAHRPRRSATATSPTPAARVGILLDAVRQHTGRTGREALAGSPPTWPASTTAASTGSSAWSGSPARPTARVRAYSLGMRQRLGIAPRADRRPRALILDEPANGLDPDGIAWMRVLLRDFADRGGTVLLSLHLLRRGGGHRRPAGDHRRRPGRRPGHAATSCSPAPGTLVRATDEVALRDALRPRRPGASAATGRRLRRRRRARGGRPRRAGRRRRPHPPRPVRGGRPRAAVLRPDHGRRASRARGRRSPTSWRPPDERRRPSTRAAPRAGADTRPGWPG